MDEYRTRVRIYAGVVVFLFFLLGLRLVQLQGFNGASEDGTPPGSAVREQSVEPARGALYARDSTLLVDNRPTYTIRITPRYFDASKAPLLANLLGVADSTVRRRLREARERNAFRPTPSFREVSFDTFSRVQEHLYELPGVSYDVELRRRYHTAARAAHALGYVHEIDEQALSRMPADYRAGDRIGRTGLEHAYESILRGDRGREMVLVNVHGTEVREYQNGAMDTPPVGGHDLHLTLDHEVQALAESLFVGKRGAAVALDPDTGGILSLVSTPDFDPSLFARSVSISAWDSLRSDPSDPLYNRATQSGYPPGSTWKPFMSLVALETGMLTASERMDCPSSYQIGRRAFKNHNGQDEGRITVAKALEVSCNTFFYQVMENMSLATWHDWALKFGFGQEVPLEGFRQEPGLIPDSSYFDQTYGRWTDGYTINLGIGQGDMSVTPLQMARYAAALGNGGRLPTPHLVRKAVHPETGAARRPELPPPDPIPVDPSHFDVVQEGMHRVMTDGTGRWVQIPDIPSAGKTGTAQNPHGEDHSLFIMFAPYDDPEIALAVVVENAGYGATAAAPIASLMAEQYLRGSIADTWERRYWKRRLREEVRSAPEDGAPSPSTSPSETTPAVQATTQPAAPTPADSSRPSASSPTDRP
ncbi:penicillin-binding protein 2 [Salinibacter ruber]|uniref:penicillin-binding protein 2 n=1 Tax=Salinibacter ruber TaxID=146919 RepID=UPI000C9F5CB6|nr:penicillin-binding protein 2 [Salinibacter ruber]MCS3646017.1 penicillin-binding protein 2 [Salinibacter ruber]